MDDTPVSGRVKQMPFHFLLNAFQNRLFRRFGDEGQHHLFGAFVQPQIVEHRRARRAPALERIAERRRVRVAYLRDLRAVAGRRHADEEFEPDGFVLPVSFPAPPRDAEFFDLFHAERGFPDRFFDFHLNSPRIP